jgi:hypothetical protein
MEKPERFERRFENIAPDIEDREAVRVGKYTMFSSRRDR